MARAINHWLAVVIGVVVAWLAVELQTLNSTFMGELSSATLSMIYFVAVVILWRVCTSAYHQLFRSKVWMSTIALSLPLVLIELFLFSQGSSLVHVLTVAAVILMGLHTSIRASKELHL